MNLNINMEKIFFVSLFQYLYFHGEDCVNINLHEETSNSTSQHEQDSIFARENELGREKLGSQSDDN